LPKEASCGGKKAVRVVEYLPNRIKLVTENACSSLLVLSESYYPGWKAQIDTGARSDAVRVNYYFMGTPVPSGPHTVTFEFKPESLKIGLIISGLSLISGIIVFILIVRKQKNNHSNE
jgi:uncharacterized membrane protein YfhO